MSSSPSSVKDKDDPDNHATSDTVQPIHIDDEPPPPVAMMSTSPEASAAAGAATAGKEKTRPKFMCGVVEGFYGRPWTTEQRKDLFCKMQAWGMDSYVYAPKDDVKHRAYWRELYTVEEAEHLQSLIQLASDCNIDFYYAISPGLDITYSSSKEITTLKRKLIQVSQLGCKCFALLFDDIEPEMCKQDKEIFQSFANAQVTVTNDIYEHMGESKFLFCPTQYCTTRALPSVRNSEYLNTIGAKLAADINIMWTGDKVISKDITVKSLEDINAVLQRPAVIWDNEHANDYDQKRVFLGPYSGRSPEIIGKLNGVMTNPNCEYGANFVAIHTLAQWSRCTLDGVEPYSNANEAISADIKLEIQDTDAESDLNPSPLPFNVYHPRNALLAAIKEWIPEFSKQKTVWGPMSKPQVVLTVTAAPLTPVQPMTVPVQQPVVLNKQPVPVALTSQLKETAVAAPGSNNNGALSNGESGLVSTTTAAAPSAIQLPQPMQPPGVPSAAPATCVMGPTATVPMITPTMLEQQKQHQDQQAQQQQPQSLANTAQPLPTAATSSITGELPPPAGAASGQLALEVPMAADPSNQLVPIVPPVPLMNSLVSTNKVVMNHSLLNPMPSGAIAPTQLVSAPLVAEIRPSPAGDGSLSPAVTAVQPQLVPASAAPVDADDGEAGGNAAEQCQDEDSPMTGTLPPSTPIEHEPRATILLPATAPPGPNYLEPMETTSATPIMTAAANGPSSTTPTPLSAASSVNSSGDLTNNHASSPTPSSCQIVPGLNNGSSSSQPQAAPSSSDKSPLAQTTPPIVGGASSSEVPMEDSSGGQTTTSTPLLQKAESTTMLCEDLSNNPEVTTMLCDDVIVTDIKEVSNPELTVRDLLLFTQLFYLPAEHGQVGLELLNDFFWLKKNAVTMLPPGTLGAGTCEDRQEWELRAAKFKHHVSEIQTLFVKLCSSQNRALVYDLYTYLWDMCGVVQTLEGFVQWLSKGCVSPKSQNYVVGQQTWFSGIREAFTSGDHEPWMFRGGLVSDLQRLLPLDSGHDLYSYKFPELPASVLFYVRPFQPKDEDAIYALAADFYEQTIDAPMGICASDRQLVGDKMAGAYLTLCPEYSFVCENSLDGSIVGYALAAPDAKTFYTRYNMAWLPEMRLKYPVKKQHLDDSSSLSPIEQMALSFHSPNAESNIPAPVAFADEKAATGAAAASNATGAPSTALHSGQPWGVMSLRVRPDEAVTDASLPKRLVMLVLACLRASGTIRMFVEPTPGDIKQREFYSSLGFTQMDLGTLPAADQPGGPEVSSSPVIPALNICMSRNF